jgi:hypothetical protein
LAYRLLSAIPIDGTKRWLQRKINRQALIAPRVPSEAILSSKHFEVRTGADTLYNRVELVRLGRVHRLTPEVIRALEIEPGAFVLLLMGKGAAPAVKQELGGDPEAPPRPPPMIFLAQTNVVLYWKPHDFTTSNAAGR